MKKLTALFLTGILLTGVLTACGQKTEQASTPTETTDNQVVLKVGATPIPHEELLKL